jgi:uncharacterized protein DUF6328
VNKGQEETHDNQELIELLNELSVILPGVQVLLAFLLAIPFTQRFERIGHLEDFYFAALLCTVVARSSSPPQRDPPHPLAAGADGAAAPDRQRADDHGHDLRRSWDHLRDLSRRRRHPSVADRGRRRRLDGPADRLSLVRPAAGQAEAKLRGTYS